MKQTLLSLLLAFFAVAGMAQKVYNENLIVTINGNSTPEIPASITVTENEDGTCGFVLKNFHLAMGGGDIAVGNVSLDKVALTDKGAYKEIATEQTIKIQPGDEEGIDEGAWIGPGLGNVPVVLKGKYNDSHLYANIDIDMKSSLGQIINVKIGKEENVPAAAAASFALANGDFNGNWVEARPWDSKFGYAGLDNVPDEMWGSGMIVPRENFVTPEGWCVSDVIGIQGLGATVVGKKAVVADGDNAVTLTNTPNPFMSSQIVPAYITLGTSWACANGMNLMMGQEGYADGGAFGGVAFNALPDAISIRYKRAHGEANATERASVIAYAWKGTYTQANVPGNTYTANTDSVSVTMYNRDRNILGIDTHVGGVVTKSDDAQLVAKAEGYIEGDAEDWTDFTVDFDYSNVPAGTLPDSLNVIISAADYFADRSLVGDGNSLTVDDVKLVYYHGIATINGKAVTFSADNKLAVREEYDAENTVIGLKGRGAKSTQSYDEATKTLTVRVEAADIAENADNYSEYTITFGDPNGVTTGISSVVAPSSADVIYDLSGRRVSNAEKGVYIVNGKKVIK